MGMAERRAYGTVNVWSMCADLYQTSADVASCVFECLRVWPSGEARARATVEGRVDAPGKCVRVLKRVLLGLGRVYCISMILLHEEY